MSDVRTVKLKFGDLQFLEDNPRTIKEPNLKRLAQRIKDDPTFFDNRPCLVNFTEGRYICYAGFQRAHAAAKVLKWKEIPCSVENDVPMDLMRRRAIYDNTHDGEWNSEVLANWEFEVEEFREMGVPEWVFGVDGEGDEDLKEPEIDPERVNAEYQNYLNQNIRQIVLYYEGELYERVVNLLKSLCKKHDIEENSTLILKLIEAENDRIEKI